MKPTRFDPSPRIIRTGGNLYHAANSSYLHEPDFSAQRPYRSAFLLYFLLLLVILYFLFSRHAHLTFLLLSIVFLAEVTLRCTLLYFGLRRSEKISNMTNFTPPRNEDLPTYTLLLPLLDERGMLDQQYKAICDLDYPMRLLDVKLIIEENDEQLIESAIQIQNHAPFAMDIMIVPQYGLLTKARACNYALKEASGELITIFDAEDIPDPGQLKRVATGFITMGDDVGCLQASLLSHEWNDLFFANQFAIEYEMLFEYLLPSLSRHHLPFPLGGTSNHLRTTLLQEIGGWDAWNVTEDADLGFRLAIAGYTSHSLYSYTLEKPPHNFTIWVKQRSRWFKGYIQLWMVQMQRPKEFYKDVGFGGFMIFHFMVLKTFLSPLLHLILFLIVLQMAWGVAAPMSLVASIICLTSYVILLIIYILGCRRQDDGWLLYSGIFLQPFYWCISIFAFMIAMGDLLFRPYHWHKTPHIADKK